MSIQSEIDRLATVKADLKAAINGASGATVGDVFGDYPGAITSGKTAIASAITDKGVETAADATFQQMADNIGQIQGGGLTPTAAPDEIINLIKTYGTLMDLTGENEGKRVTGGVTSTNPPLFVGAYVEVSPAYADQYKSQCLFGYGTIDQLFLNTYDSGLRIQGGALFFDNWVSPAYTKLYVYGFDNLQYE